jgi:hypothetical protein
LDSSVNAVATCSATACRWRVRSVRGGGSAGSGTNSVNLARRD